MINPVTLVDAFPGTTWYLLVCQTIAMDSKDVMHGRFYDASAYAMHSKLGTGSMVVDKVLMTL